MFPKDGNFSFCNESSSADAKIAQALKCCMAKRASLLSTDRIY
ncbi:hypothetical protein EV286_104526 [Rhizobium sp. BK251]|nr:hypothetical protein EV286_104526 [Rhizobium sp. BK251]